MTHDEIGYSSIPSGFGAVTVLWREDESGPKVVEILLPLKRANLEETTAVAKRHEALEPLAQAIGRYLAGENVEFPIDQLDATHCSKFQWTVLMAERAIPRGYASSYSALAAHIGRPKAARAVGTALARNPFPIVIPCHRAVRSDGSLGGFGGGLPMKRALLEMEGVAFDAAGRVKPQYFCDWSTRS